GCRAHGPREPEAARLAQSPLQARHGAELAEQADFADGDGPRTHGPVAQRRRERKRDGEVEPGLVGRQPAGEVRVYVVAREPDPRPTAEDGDEEREPAL